MILVLSCGAAGAASLCPFDTPACRMMPDRYIAPQMAPDGRYHRPTDDNPYNSPQMPQRYIAPRINPDGRYEDEE
jgi:hypothetical protein